MNNKFLPGAVLFIIAFVLSSLTFLNDAKAQTNTFYGEGAGINVTTGVANSGFGFYTLDLDDSGSFNTAIGNSALSSNTAGKDNTASGGYALFDNTTGNYNTASGNSALLSNTTGNYNTASGYQALYYDTTGHHNTASGYYGLQANTIGNYNTASGEEALYYNTTGTNNMASGSAALYANTTGNQNTASGATALFYNTTGSSNIGVGYLAGINLTTGDNNIDIGNEGVAGESNTNRIGKQGTQTATFIAGIRGTPITGAMAVGVNSSGQLGVRASAARFKEAIQPMDKASEAILALKPVTFRYKKEIDPNRTPEFGLVAEEVAKVNPDLVVRDDQGKVFTVRYEAVNAMLLNEFLKEHKTIAELKSTIALQQRAIEQLATQMQKVSAQMQLNGA